MIGVRPAFPLPLNKDGTTPKKREGTDVREIDCPAVAARGHPMITLSEVSVSGASNMHGSLILFPLCEKAAISDFAKGIINTGCIPEEWSGIKGRRALRRRLAPNDQQVEMFKVMWQCARYGTRVKIPTNNRRLGLDNMKSSEGPKIDFHFLHSSLSSPISLEPDQKRQALALVNLASRCLPESNSQRVDKVGKSINKSVALLSVVSKSEGLTWMHDLQPSQGICSRVKGTARPPAAAELFASLYPEACVADLQLDYSYERLNKLPRFHALFEEITNRL